MSSRKFIKNNKHVFLDLEQTLIDSWDNPFTFNQSKHIRFTLQHLSFRPTNFHLFTWAINNQSELRQFKSQTLPHIEKEFRIKIDHIILKDECLQITKNIRKIQVLDEFDLSQLIGKGDAFFDFCKFHQITDSVLFDDTVENSKLSFTHGLCGRAVAELVNVKFQKDEL